VTVLDLSSRRISPDLSAWQATLDAAQGRAVILTRDRLPSDAELLWVHRELNEMIGRKR
jgi:hypothetical protein